MDRDSTIAGLEKISEEVKNRYGIELKKGEKYDWLEFKLPADVSLCIDNLNSIKVNDITATFWGKTSCITVWLNIDHRTVTIF